MCNCLSTAIGMLLDTYLDTQVMVLEAYISIYNKDTKTRSNEYITLWSLIVQALFSPKISAKKSGIFHRKGGGRENR